MAANGDTPGVQSAVNGLVKDLASQLTRIPQDIKVIHSLIEAAFNNELINDKKYIKVPVSFDDIAY